MRSDLWKTLGNYADVGIIPRLIAYSFFISSRLNSVEGRLVITHS